MHLVKRIPNRTVKSRRQSEWCCSEFLGFAQLTTSKYRCHHMLDNTIEIWNVLEITQGLEGSGNNPWLYTYLGSTQSFLNALRWVIWSVKVSFFVLNDAESPNHSWNSQHPVVNVNQIIHLSKSLDHIILLRQYAEQWTRLYSSQVRCWSYRSQAFLRLISTVMTITVAPGL